MLKLIGKDWLATRWIFLANLGALFLYSLQPYFAGGFIVFFGGILVLAGLSTIFFYEDRNRTEILYLCLPVGRRAIVAARHLFGLLILAAAGAAIFGLIGPVSEWLRPNPAGLDPFPILTVEAVAVFTVLSAFFSSLYLVFYHRFGFGRGTTVFTMVSLVLIAVLVAAVVSCFPADFDLTRNASGANTMFGALQALRLSLGTPLFLLAAVLLVTALYAVSLRLSLRFYARREF